MFFKIAAKVTKYLSTFEGKSCHQELDKIAQSGHTAYFNVSFPPPVASLLFAGRRTNSDLPRILLRRSDRFHER